eukprot:8812672-Karenia_brevis.AAC.1
MLRKRTQPYEKSRLTFLHDLHAQLCDAATQVFYEIGNHFDCYASPELFDVYNDSHCALPPIDHVVAAAQATAAASRLVYSCTVANTFHALESDDCDDSVDDRSLNDSNSEELANTHMSGIDCSFANLFEARECDDCDDADDDHSLKDSNSEDLTNIHITGIVDYECGRLPQPKHASLGLHLKDINSQNPASICVKDFNSQNQCTGEDDGQWQELRMNDFNSQELANSVPHMKSDFNSQNQSTGDDDCQRQELRLKDFNSQELANSDPHMQQYNNMQGGGTHLGGSGGISGFPAQCSPR